MWTRKLLKENAKIAFKRNYWLCVLVSLIAMLLGVGASGSSLEFEYEENRASISTEYGEVYLDDLYGYNDTVSDILNPVLKILASPILPGKNNFVKALRKLHPEITTVVLNVNDKKTSMVLGDKETVLYGKGYIEDTLCDYVFRISSKSFYTIVFIFFLK